ncbi:apolipoprotein B-100 [Sardina pilchardus]|uniref:apolipoprotein B-100 n=1 Tax=Sardina pilchardus TaxID=27697 RepID=UPI002E13736A
MRDTTLGLLLLLSVQALAEQGLESGGEEFPSSCPLEERYKSYRKYLYTYTAESRNGVAGTANLRNGPKVSCKVELVVLQACAFILHTTECSLSEVSVIDAQGQPVYRQAAGSEAFQAAMERRRLSFTVEMKTEVSLYPSEEEKNILNVKRGIISALLAPSMNAQDNKVMATIHGLCKSSVVTNAHEDIDTDVTVHRWDLAECSHFSPRRLPSSPLALIRGLHTPLSMLVSSSQECNYQFDNRRKHMTAALCTEKHLFRPFSHNEQYGMSSVVTQTLTLQDTAKSNKRYFETPGRPALLYLEEAEDKRPLQSKDSVLSTMRDLSGLPPDQGHQRAGLFYKLVWEMRGLHNRTLAAAAEEMMGVSAPLAWQALVQCGTPECHSALLVHLRRPDVTGPAADALVYAMGAAGLHSSPEVIWDLLAMAEARNTRPVIYALGYAVKDLFAEGETHEAIVAAAEFLKLRLGDCTGEEDSTILTLRVIGMIGIAVQDKVQPALLSCVSQSAASPLVQRTAIKALRKMDMKSEIMASLLQIFQDEGASPQTRMVVYMTIMGNPGSDVTSVLRYFQTAQMDPEVKNFVASHLINVLSVDNPGAAYSIQDEVISNFIEVIPNYDGKSRHRVLNLPHLASLESHYIAEQYSRLPKEVILKIAGNFLDGTEDIEVGVEGLEGLEPFAEALVGEDGLVPNLLLTTMSWLGDNTSPQLKKLLDKLFGSTPGDRQKRQLPQDIFNKFMEKLKSQDSSEILAYVRLLRRELGYIKTSDLKQLGEDIAKYASIVFKDLPTKGLKAMLSGEDNELFGHYIFMDENMVLPTGSGFPLRLSLSGVFAPGARGGISVSPDMHQVSFMPSAGVEFITHMGVHIPEFVAAGIEMHTNLYHESALNAKVTIARGQVKLSIPPPEGDVQLFSISNKLLSVSSSQPKIVPSLVEDRTDTTECHPLFTGLKYCTTMRYSNASSNSEAPYYPLTGETKFALDLQPTGEVTEYTATVAYKLLSEGKQGRHKVDSVKIDLKMEGSEPCEATAIMKYNRNKGIFTTDLQVPDTDFEAGLKLTAGDSNVKGKKMKGFTIDVTNKNVPQMSLVARARLESMKDALVQVEMEIPSLLSKATTTATLKKENGLILQLETDIDIPKMSSIQTAIVRYDENKVEVELKSDMNSDFDKLFPNMEGMRNNLQAAIDDMLDQKVPKTDMKLRHIVSKGFEAVNIWLDKVAADVPYVNNLRSRRSIPELPPVPEKLFMKWETLFRYQFNKGRMTISLPLPLGGQSSDDLRIPPELSIPNIFVPEIGLDIPANTIRIPSFSIPEDIDFSMPMLGLAELTTKVTSSLCSWEGSVLGGNNTADVPSFIGQYKIISDCILPFKAEGAGMITGTFEESLKYVVNSSLSHSLLDASFSASETIAWKDDVVGRTNYRLQASSPLGLSASLHSSSQSLSKGDEVKGDGDMDGDIKVGPLFAKFEYTMTYMFDGKNDNKGESTFKLDSSVIQLENKMNGDFTDEVLTVRSRTMTPNEALKHMLELKLEDCKFTLKSDATAKVLSNTINNKVALGIACEAANLKVETEIDDGKNRAYGVLSGTLDGDGLETSADGSVVFDSCRGSHKSSHNINSATGLTTSGTTNLQCSPMTFENSFDGRIDDTRATLSVTSKAAGRDNDGELKIEGTVTSSQAAVNTVLKGNLFDTDIDYTSSVGLTPEGLTYADSVTGALGGMTTRNSHSLKITLWTLTLRSKSDCFVCDGTSYKHDINVNLKPFVATISTNNDIELFDMSLSNEGQLKLEPLKLDLSGSITGASIGGDQMKHACSINYADLAGFVKCSTNVKLSETQFNHNFELQYAGLASKLSSEALINSKVLRLESTLRTMAEPFSLTVDAILNSDSEVDFYGKHKGQLYSKYLLRAKPLGIAHSHDCRASATHKMPSGATHETHLENKLEGVLTPSEQSWLWKIKSKINDHAYNQDISTYNNDERMGIEYAGVVFTNLVNKAAMSDDPDFQSDHSFDNQEFSLSAFLKYDKNSDSHILSLPSMFIHVILFYSPGAAYSIQDEVISNFIEVIPNYDGKSRHRVLNLPHLASLESHYIAEQYSRLPKEVILKIAGNFLDGTEDIEVGVEGLEGLEPFAEALVGEDGLVPNLLLTTMSWLGDNTSPQLKKLLDKLFGSTPGDRQKRQLPQDIFNKFMEKLKSQDSSEILAYVRLLRRELGYIKTSDLKQLGEDIAKYASIVFKDLPTKGLKAMLSGEDNELFGHYIFMDENMVLPTGSGFPLRLSLSGVFAPGARGGISVSPDMHQVSFMPSAGVEFITHMGVHIPEFVAAGIEMHTNLYHESALNAKVTIARGQVKLSIPPPEGDVQLFSISNKLLSVSSSQPKIVPSLVEDRTDTTECHPLFTGLKYCTTMRYSNASSNSEAPYYPLTGETKFALDLQPTGEVTEYTATVAYKLLSEGKQGRHKVDSVKIDLKMEGSEPCEATAIMKYNRNKGIFTTDLQVPDTDFEAGLKLTAGDSNVKGKKMKGFTIDVTNKNVPQMSLVARARLESMKDALVQVEMEIPSLLSKATTTATLKKENGLILQLETDIDIPKMSSIQTAIVRYDENKVEVELKSDMNSDFDKLFPNMEGMRNNLQAAIDDMLDQKVPKTDMKLRHIVSKGFEAVNIWLDKVAADVPYVNNLRSRRSIPELPPVPEKLFMKWETLFRYQFNKGRMTISLPLPLGGQSSDDLRIPPELSIPNIFVPEIGLDIPANTIRIPSFSIPEDIDFSMPMLGLAELTTKVTSSLCSWEGSVLGGNNTADVPSFIGQYKIISDCILPFKAEGAGMITGTFEESLKYVVNSSLSHSLLDASFSASETIAWKDDVVGRTNYRLQASSPLGLSASLHSSSQSLSKGDEVKGDGDMDGDIKVGPLFAKFEYTMTYMFDGKNDNKGESTFKLDSSVIQLENKMNGDFTDEVLTVRSRTMTPNEALKHMLELKLEDCKFTLKSDATAKVLSNTINNKVALGIACEAANLKVETEIDDGKNRAYGVLSGTLDGDGLETSADGSVVFDSCRGSHKSSHNINSATGLTTSGTTNLQCSPMTFENSFDGRIDDTRATLSVTSKAAGRDNDGELKIEGTVTSSQAAVNTVLKGNLFDTDIDYTSSVGLTPEGLTYADSVTGALGGMTTRNSHSLKITLWTLTLRSKSDCFVCDGTSYKHDINVNLKPFVATISTNNDIELFDMSLSNEGQLKLEPLKLDLSGSITGASIGGDQMKHACSINYADLAGFVKCSTNVKLSETQFNHNFELQYAGLASKLSSEALINSKVLRLESTLRTMAEPFSLTVDAILNSDSEVDFYGKHKGQLYSKYLLRAKPLGIAHSHDCRASATHKMPSGATHETHLENKLEGVLTPSEQSWLWKIKSKINDHAYNQDISTYNNDERMGIEYAGVVFTNLVNKAAMSDDPDFQSDHSFDNQEFSLSAFLKYDKNSDSHILSLPYIENLPEAFEQLKASIVNALEAVQQYIDSLDVNNAVAEFRATLEKIPQDVENYITDLDLEGKFKQATEALVSWMNSYAISVDDLEAIVENLREDFEKSLLDTASKIRDMLVQIKEYVESGTLSDTIYNFFRELGTALRSFDETYQLSQTLVRAIEAIEDIVRQIDMEKLTDSSLGWLQDLDINYGIRDWLQEKVNELKQTIDTFDIMMLAQDLKEYIENTIPELIQFLSQISDRLPTDDIKNTLETIKDILVNWLDEYEIDRKINSVISKIQDLFQRYEIDQKFEMLTNDFVELIKQYKVHETLQQVAEELKKIKIEYFFNKFMQVLDDVINQLKSIDFKQSIDDLNEYISTTAKAIQEFDYKSNIDDANQKISEVIEYVNEHIRTYEIPQKIEASRQFLREIQSTIWNYLDQVKATRVGEVLVMLKDVLDKTAYKDIQFKVQDMLEDVRQRVTDMDIKAEIMYYLERASESYTNMLAYISLQFDKLIETIRQVTKDQEILDQISNSVEGILDALKKAEIRTPSFTVPLTDLTIPTVTIVLQNLQDIEIPSSITIPEFSILEIIEVPPITIDFDRLKQLIIDLIDEIRAFELPIVELEAMFGDLRVLYMSDLPDLTFPGITLSEIRIPDITLPKLNCENFDITKLPIPEVKLPKIPSEVQVPAFGKLYGEVRINSPHYTLMTGAKLENSTTAPKSPQFTATLSSQAKSTFELLEFSLDGTLRLEAPRMKKMVLKETLKASHVAFNIDHEGTLIFSGLSAEVTANTTAKATTEMYTADLVNHFELALKNGISATMATNYNHNLNIPVADILSQATMTQISKAQFESGAISVTVGTIGSGKLARPEHHFSDEGTHKSKLEFNVNIGTATCEFNGETISRYYTLRQDINIESAMLDHVTINVILETEAPPIESSRMTLQGVAKMEDLKLDLKANHNAVMRGPVRGTISNSLEFLAKPFEMVLDSKNKGNVRIVFPFKLTGKVDLQNDYGFILNPEKQRVCIVGLARFNQYKYNHNFTLDNNKYDVGIYGAMNGEANLDFLTVPLSVPEMTLPYFNVKTPTITDVSLWEDLGLNALLTTPRQNFDMNFNLLYQKNPDTHAFYFDLVPVYNIINNNAEFLQTNFEMGRDWVFDNLMESYNHAKSQYEKYKIDTSSQPPKYFRIPGYTVPVLNIEVSAFRAEMPAFSFIIPKEVSTPSFKVPALGFSVPSYTLVLPSPEVPVLYLPETLRELSLPTLRLPEVQNSIMIPAMGNMTYDFSFKSAMITLNANGGLYNQSDIVGRLGATSTSVFDVLKGKFEGTTRLTTNRGLKLATAMALEHKNVEGTHDGSLSCTRRGLEGTMANIAKVNSPILTLELDQESSLDSHSSPNVVTKLKGKYNFNIPYIDARGGGDIEHKTDLGMESIYISVDSYTKGKMDGTVMETGKFSAGLNNEASFFLGVVDHRSSLATLVQVKYDHDDIKILNIELSELLALEASPRRLFATMKLAGNNEAYFTEGAFLTDGKQSVQATLEMVPLTMVLLHTVVDFSQQSPIGDAELLQKMNLDLTAEKQSLKWSGKEQITPIIHACDLVLSNDRAEIRMEATQSLEGYLAFLKSIKLPVYQKTVWDVLKFDQVTNTEERQFINGSTVVVYTKSPEGYKFGFGEIPALISDINDFLENVDLDFSLPHTFSTPHIDVPFTNFYIRHGYVDLNNIEIPDEIALPQIDISLPGLPQLTIPALEIGTKYFEGEHILLKLPKFELAWSGIQQPRFLDDIMALLPDCGVPPFHIPKQYIEIPEMSLKLPAVIFIPTFGALSTTVKVSSPIYTETWTTVVENKYPEILTSFNAACTSTMAFLAYDLDAKATWRIFDEAFSMNGISKLTHNDLNVNWQHTLAQNIRSKRQEPQDDSSHHTLNVDITSPTFIDVSCRYASQKNGITASVSSPSAGFIGFQLQRRSPSQYHGKIFGRYPSSPDKDTDMVTLKATLRNSEKLSLQIAWNWNTVSDLLYGVKQNAPHIAASLKKCINKYHTAHLGMDLNRASLKMKNGLSNTIERAYHEVPQMVNSVENSIEQLEMRTQEVITRVAKSIPSVDLQEMRNRFSARARELYKYYEKNARVLLDAIMQFLKETKFHLPGLEEKLSGQELYHRVRKSVSAAIEQVTKSFTSLMESIYSLISGIEITLPYFDKVIRGQEILDSSLPTMESIEEYVGETMKKWENLRLETLFKSLNDFLKFCITKVEEFITSLQDVRLSELLYEFRYHVAELGATPAMEGIRSALAEAKGNAAAYKDMAKVEIQNMYNGLTMENINQTVIVAADVFESHFLGGANEFHDQLRHLTQGAEPYIKIYNKKAEVEIPLPFFWKSFSEWPTQTRE